MIEQDGVDTSKLGELLQTLREHGVTRFVSEKLGLELELAVAEDEAEEYVAADGNLAESDPYSEDDGSAIGWASGVAPVDLRELRKALERP